MHSFVFAIASVGIIVGGGLTLQAESKLRRSVCNLKGIIPFAAISRFISYCLLCMHCSISYLTIMLEL
jgi:hypothetical protein